MTYPDDPNGLGHTGIFQEPGKAGDDLRTRLASIGLSWFHQCQNERTPQERQWHLNLAFYYGNQHAKFRMQQGGGAFDLYVPKAPKYRVRVVINQIRRVVRKEISRLTAQKPNAYVVPASTEDADVFAAQAAETIWDSLYRRVRFNKTLREAVFWQAVCGNAYIKSYWDPTKIDIDSGKAGDVVIEDITPFHIFVPDLMSTDIEEQPYVIHAQVRNNSWIRQNFKVDPANNKLETVDEALQNVMGVHRNENKKDKSIVLEIWVKPGYLPELPKGGMFTIAANQVVQGFDYWPYEHGQYPFAKLDGIPTGKYYNSSVVEDLIPIQQELNRSRAQIIEAKNKMSKPQLVAEEGAVDPRKITTEPGQVITFKTGFQPPQPLPLQNIPGYVTEEINRLYTDISDLSGQHEVSNGSTPPGVTAATAISFLQEQDESLIATHYTSLEEGIEKAAGQSLTYVKMYWDEPRLVKIVGIDKTFDVQTFIGADLKGNTDIRIESGSALPTSRAAKQAFIMDLMKMGFIQPAEGLEILEVGGLDRIYDRIQTDKRQAQRENLKMRVITDEDILKHEEDFKATNPEALKDVDSKQLNLVVPPLVPVHTYDNHAIHIEVHNNYRKSQNFEMASSTTKRLFEEHVRQHEEALANQMVHPMSGMEPSNPNAPSPDEEEAAMDEAGIDQSEEEQPGPVPMPETESESPEGI